MKEKRRKFNLRAMFVGGTGSLAFALSVVLSDVFELADREVAILFSFVLPVLMLCWGFAIWHFIKISRIGDEIKYLQKMELMQIKANGEKDTN